MSMTNVDEYNNLRYTIASEPTGTCWPFEEFVRIHGEYDDIVVADSKFGFHEYGIFEDANKTRIVTCVSNIVKKYSDEEFEKNKVNLEVIVLDSKMYCVCTKWENVALFEQIKQSWSLMEFAKAHGKMQVGEFKDKETGAIFKACIFTNPNDGTRTFVAFSTKLGELTPKEIAAQKNELYVAQLKSGNFSLYKKRNNDWENVVLDNSKKSNPSKKEESPAIDIPQETLHSSRSDEKKGNWMNYDEIKKEALAPYASITTSAKTQEFSASTRSRKDVHIPKDKKPTSIHYQAAFIAMLIAFVLGICAYSSDMIHIKQDRILFIIMCSLLSIAAWGYPYFETTVKVDNDGCFEQGCIHPIIGVFSIVLFPLFIHYWLYKGIRICLVQLEKRFHRK